MTDFRPDPIAIAALLRGPQGPAARHVIGLATRVQNSARGQVGVASGKLRDSIVKRPGVDAQGFFVDVVAATPYATLHHEGTRPHLIEPRQAKVLRFKSGGATVFAARVQHPGTQPNRFLTDALEHLGLGGGNA